MGLELSHVHTASHRLPREARKPSTWLRVQEQNDPTDLSPTPPRPWCQWCHLSQVNPPRDLVPEALRLTINCVCLSLSLCLSTGSQELFPEELILKNNYPWEHGNNSHLKWPGQWWMERERPRQSFTLLMRDLFLVTATLWEWFPRGRWRSFQIQFHLFATSTAYEMKSISLGCNYDCHAPFTKNQRIKDRNK